MTLLDKDDAIDPIDALRSEMKRVPLSPEFAARLRQRIDEAPAVRGAAWLGGWRWLVPVAAVAAVVIAVVLLRQPQVSAPEVVAVQTTSNAASPRAVPAPAAPEGTSNFEVRTSKFGRAASQVRSAAPAPALEVITNQPAILRALWARAGRGAAIVEVPITQMPDPSPEIVVPPIEISPIVVNPLGEPLTVPGALPIIR